MEDKSDGNSRGSGSPTAVASVSRIAPLAGAPLSDEHVTRAGSALPRTGFIDDDHDRPARERSDEVGAGRKALLLSPIFAALAYPHLLRLFNAAVDPLGPFGMQGRLVAALSLFAAFAVPAYGLAMALRLSKVLVPTRFELRARRLAYATMVAPPLFVFAGVSLGLIGRPITDLTAWSALWCALGVLGWVGDTRTHPEGLPTVNRLRIVHGIVAGLLVFYVLFHIGNHVAGMLGPAAHARVMDVGRAVYRSSFIEPVLITLFLAQVATGLRLAWVWSAPRTDFYRGIQIGSGIYLAAFIITHLNSALVSARAVRGIETNWDWASGQPEGLLLDAWNIRLLPHYSYGALFVLMHLACGLRGVLLAHGFQPALINRLWWIAVAAGAVIAGLIVCGLLGGRL